MKKQTVALLLLMAIVTILSSCHHTETYADQRKKEVSAINRYLADSTVNVISEAKFAANDFTTDVSKNEFVLFESSGVYMQIVRQGCGEKLKNGETANVLCRFTEWNLLTDSITLSNTILYYASIVDKMVVKNTLGTFTASFDQSSSVMYSTYGYTYKTTAVPSGWLVPLTYINLGRPQQEGEEIAKVKLIVPHSEGHSYASQNVVPYLYEITYQRGR
ncbi:MAG: DUF4827 domain-containing protein [Prevotella sp.]|nr:DUF4827 domain-containing protein [Prevotella sp.]